MSTDIIQNIISFPLKMPKIALMLTFIIVISCGFGVTKLKFSDDIRIFFAKDNPQLITYEQLEDAYSKSNSILFIVAPKNGSIYNTDTLKSIEQLTKKGWKIPYSRRVDSLTNFQHTYGIEDDLIVENLVKNIDNLSHEDLKKIENIATNEPLLAGRLLSMKGHMTGVNVIIDLPGKNPLIEQPHVVKAARNLASEIMAQNPNINIYLTGLIMINNALAEEGKADMELLVPIMLVVILIIMSLVLRNFSGIFTTLLVIIFSIVVAMGLAGWIGIILSPPVLSASNIIMTIAVADSVHILVGFLKSMRSGLSKNDALLDILRKDFKPIMITSITTALGFLSMNFSDSPPFRDLGNIVAFGVVAACIFTFLFKPALLMLLPCRLAPTKSMDTQRDYMLIFANWIIKHHKALFVSSTILAILTCVGILKNSTNDEFLKYFHQDLPFRVATDLTISEMTGFEFIEYSLESGEPGGISNPEFLRKVDEFATWFKAQDKVKHVYNFVDIMKRLNKNMHNEDNNWYKVPADRELAAQYLLLYEMSLPFGLDITNQIDIDKSAMRMRVSLDHITSNEIIELEKKAAIWLEKNAKGIFTSNASGQSLMFAHIGSKNIQSLLGGSVLALFLISALLVFAFGSFKFGLISLIPNLLPAAMAFGIWGFMVGQVGLGLAVVVGMTLGIVVDDTIHFLNSYLRYVREKNMSAQDAVRQAFNTAGRAITITSIVLIAGFSILGLSNFELNSGMAIMSALTIAVALFSDFILLPSLLILLEKKHVEKVSI